MDGPQDGELVLVGHWAKRCYFAARALMDATLRPYGLGATQWYVLSFLNNGGPAVQRDLARALDIERATLSGVVATLVRKGLVCQVAGVVDQRQRLLKLTDAGDLLWQKLPDLRFIRDVAFDGIDPGELQVTMRVLQTATDRLGQLLGKESKS
ncbi:MarR family transcriptional regulator [Neorhizobium sp. NCHU2750]|uniref:MarR family winged helix-turn-helix transcriptional regulator n=1 Tax=Neorhizobium sp. NCHU2750 TaxID=1825976 RepID=UPI000E747AFE|nr:MarR family transcriptional regulator [Neorhizobium sp. NCHU2750]